MEEKFANGLPKKSIEYIECIQDFEKHELFPVNVSREIKTFILKESDLAKTTKVLNGFYFVELQIWFDFGNQYLVCIKADLDTLEYFKKGKNKFRLASYDEKTGSVTMISECTLNFRVH